MLKQSLLARLLSGVLKPFPIGHFSQPLHTATSQCIRSSKYSFRVLASSQTSASVVHRICSKYVVGHAERGDWHSENWLATSQQRYCMSICTRPFTVVLVVRIFTGHSRACFVDMEVDGTRLQAHPQNPFNLTSLAVNDILHAGIMLQRPCWRSLSQQRQMPAAGKLRRPGMTAARQQCWRSARPATARRPLQQQVARMRTPWLLPAGRPSWTTACTPSGRMTCPAACGPCCCG
jgi:hypothetical protein